MDHQTGPVLRPHIFTGTTGWRAWNLGCIEHNCEHRPECPQRWYQWALIPLFNYTYPHIWHSVQKSKTGRLFCFASKETLLKHMDPPFLFGEVSVYGRGSRTEDYYLASEMLIRRVFVHSSLVDKIADLQRQYPFVVFNQHV